MRFHWDTHSLRTTTNLHLGLHIVRSLAQTITHISSISAATGAPILALPIPKPRKISSRANQAIIILARQGYALRTSQILALSTDKTALFYYARFGLARLGRNRWSAFIWKWAWLLTQALPLLARIPMKSFGLGCVSTPPVSRIEDSSRPSWVLLLRCRSTTTNNNGVKILGITFWVDMAQIGQTRPTWPT